MKKIQALPVGEVAKHLEKSSLEVTKEQMRTTPPNLAIHVWKFENKPLHLTC